MKEKLAFISFILSMGAVAAAILSLKYENFYGLGSLVGALDWTMVIFLLLGLISGIFGLKSKRSALAKTGIVLCIIGLICRILFMSL